MGLRRLIRFLRGATTPAATGFVTFRDADAVVRGRVIGPAGLGLIVTRDDGGGLVNRIVRASDCLSSTLFWREWREVGGGPLFDENGRPYDPEYPSE